MTRPVTDELDGLVHGVLLPGFAGTQPPDWLLRRLDRGLGGVVLFSRNVVDVPQVRALADALHVARPTALVAVDEEGGDVTRLETATGSSFPGALALGAVDDVALTRAVAAELGGLLRSAGVDWTLAPVADVNSNPLNPVIGVRSFGADPVLVARHVAAFVAGLQDDAGVLACAKHFPGHGDTAEDSHVGLPVVTDTRAQLDVTALPPFRAAVESGVAAVMTSHLRVLALDPDVPATLSAPVLRGLLREELGFAGVIVTDALEMAGVAAFCGLEEGAVRALLAGADALCLGGELADEGVVERTAAAVRAAVVEGRLPLARLAAAGERVAAMQRGRREPALDADGSRAAAPMRVAALALDVRGDVRVPPGPDPVVASVRWSPTVAVGTVDWDLAARLREWCPRTTGVTVTDAADSEQVVALAAGRPLVLVVRDPHRQGWQAALLDRVLAARPDAVVVDLGLPNDVTAALPRRVVAHGAGGASLTAVARRLAGAA